jgi:hypothetical protein
LGPNKFVKGLVGWGPLPGLGVIGYPVVRVPIEDTIAMGSIVAAHGDVIREKGLEPNTP